MELKNPQWRKSSRNTDNGGACVQVAVWRKASRSGDNGGHCVEVAMMSVTGDAARGDRA